MSRFSVRRLRNAVAWAEAEANGDLLHTRGGNWDQGTWARGLKGRIRRVKTIDGYPVSEVLEASDELVEVKCKSSFCVAGWACAAEHDAFVAPSWANSSRGLLADYVIPKGTKEAISIEKRARDLFGITDREANDLFAGSNTIEDIRRIATRIAAKRGRRL